MEFYGSDSLYIPLPTLVSIPNGMEFYKINGSNVTSLVVRFNSQRDGILQEIQIICDDEEIVFQFPTGWNSTHLMHREPRRIKRFQFPTGWNSTPTIIGKNAGILSFNSQRDGILPGNLRRADWI